MRKISFVSILAIAFLVLTSFTVDPQGTKKPEAKAKTEKKAKPKKKTVKLKSKSVDKGQANANIKQDKPSSDVMSAGDNCAYTCYTTVSNYTYYSVDIYLDGIYTGTIGPRAYTTMATCNGYTKFYGISAGKTKEWSSTGDCQFNFAWNLYD